MIYSTSAHPKVYWVWENEEGDLSVERWDNPGEAVQAAIESRGEDEEEYRAPTMFLEKMQWNSETEEYDCISEEKIKII